MTEFSSTASPEGRLIIELQAQHNGLNVDLRSERPLHACRIFEGKPISETLRLLPMLFSICGQAQSVAAVRAIENATQKHSSTKVEQRRNLLITLEGIREHLWRMLLDWPLLLGGKSDALVFAPLNRDITALLKLANPNSIVTAQPGLRQPLDPVCKTFQGLWQTVRTSVLKHLFSDPNFSIAGNTPSADCEANRLLQALDKNGWSTLGNMTLGALPELAEEQLTHIITGPNSDRFIRSPDWQNSCYETGPFARQKKQSFMQAIIEQYGSGAYSRMYARLAELQQMMSVVDADLAGACMFRTKHSKTNAGIAQVEAVRGKLIHYIELEGDKIFRYRIVAPTEWNFHNDGIVKKMLGSLMKKSTGVLTAEARLLIQLIDPCVGYKLRVNQDTQGSRHHA